MKEIPKMLKKNDRKAFNIELVWNPACCNTINNLIWWNPPNRVLVSKNQTFLIQIGLDILQSSIWLSI